LRVGVFSSGLASVENIFFRDGDVIAAIPSNKSSNPPIDLPAAAAPLLVDRGGKFSLFP